MLTKEEYTKLMPYTDIWEKLHNGANRVIIPSEVRNIVTEIIKRIENREIKRTEWNCPKCAYKIYVKISQLFYTYEDTKPTKKNNKPKKSK